MMEVKCTCGSGLNPTCVVHSLPTKYNDTCIQNAADDEPVFCLRAQDASAAAVIQVWLTLNPQLSLEKTARVIRILAAFQEWPKKKKAD